MKSVTIFGATGSVGQSAVDLIVRHPEDYDVVALTGGRNITQLAKDAVRLKAKVAVTCHDDLLNDLKSLL
ncbi:MAG: 1-deoxy-D-xylulose-5-phosphate reductoisomerase, partial [Paracoccaceae bacterium]|nr:1-deoxy-D-xylulose-5-phosphate reductoisomerase [Paracoccaceae bacterium]